MRLYKFLFVTGFLILLTFSIQPDTIGSAEMTEQPGATNPVIPVLKQTHLEEGYFSFQDNLNIFTGSKELEPLYNVLKKELRSLYLIEVIQKANKAEADIVLKIDDSLDEETYRIKIQNNIEVTGGSYRAVAMGTVSMLQIINEEKGTKNIRKGTIYDYPDLPFRGLMVDVARKQHHIAVLKQIVSLCRWYKINYLQLHLTDDNAFRFPSEAYPQLISKEFPGKYSGKYCKSIFMNAQFQGLNLLNALYRLFGMSWAIKASAPFISS